MKTLEEFVMPTQQELFNALRKQFKGKAISRKGAYILVPGEAPVMLLAHMDTVHKERVKTICKSKGGDVLMSPQGIGGDDRCGVYALVSVYDRSPVKPWLLFTCDEEIGCVGAERFCAEHSRKGNKLPKGLDSLKFLVEIDRKGNKDAVYYDCDNPNFEAYITSKGFVTAEGSFTDISYVAPELGVAAVNLSSGYYNAHTQHEYIVRSEIDAVIKTVLSIVVDAANPATPRYEFMERKHWSDRLRSYIGWDDWGSWENRIPASLSTAGMMDDTLPDDLPDEYKWFYDELLDFYTKPELEEYRRVYGDDAILTIYESEFGENPRARMGIESEDNGGE